MAPIRRIVVPARINIVAQKQHDHDGISCERPRPALHGFSEVPEYGVAVPVYATGIADQEDNRFHACGVGSMEGGAPAAPEADT